jgi:hypothetical protein
MMAHTCYPSCTGNVIGSGLFKKKTKEKGLRVWLKWQAQGPEFKYWCS